MEIETASLAQYGEVNRTAVAQSSKADKVALIDDFDQCQLNPDRKSALIAELRERFGRVILTVGENYEVAEVFGGKDMLDFAAMRHIKILPLGHARRLELIKKWNRIGINETVSENEFLKACDDAEKLIESTKLRYVASTVPIFVLSLLQATSSGVATEMHNSSFAHYYYYLILGAFDKAKVPKDQLNLMLSICTRLSWFIKNEGRDQRISLRQFRSFISDYSDKWTATDPDALLQAFTECRLMEVDGDALRFTYPYSYYYFLGRYASVERDADDVKEYVNYCLKHLYARECANTLLFLAHHSGNSSVLDLVTKAIDGHFASKSAASLEKADIASIAALLAHAPTLRYSGMKPHDYREKNAAHKDESDDDDGLHDEPAAPDAKRDLFQDIVSLSKAIEIAGTLLTHQYANYDRATKNLAIQSMFNGAMRGVKMFHSHFENIDELMDSVKSRLQEKHVDMNDEQIDVSIRHAIAFVIRLVTASFVLRAGMNLQSKELADNISTVVADNPTSAYRLIRLGQELQRPSRLPRIEIDRLRREEGTNPAVMDVLQLLMLQRLYAYETSHDDKDWAMEMFALGGHRSVVELKQQGKPPKRLTH